MAIPNTFHPSTAEERQAALTVRSADDALAEIEQLRRILASDGQSKELLRRARINLLDASERLGNLMALAAYQIDKGLQGKARDQLDATIKTVRARLLDIGTDLPSVMAGPGAGQAKAR